MVLVVAILYLIRASICATISDENSLHDTLLNGYKRGIRPGVDRNQALNITIEFYFTGLREFDESSSKFALTGALGVEWDDNRLTWNPASHNFLDMTTFKQSEIWLPLLLNLNSYGNLKPLGYDDISCIVTHYGRVSWTPPAIFETTCDADVTYYPFDSQSCKLSFYFPGFNIEQIRLIAGKSQADMKMYESNGVWDITSTNMYSFINDYKFEEFRIKVNMNRRTTFYIVGLILPVCLMNFLSIVVFVLPVESGERVGFSITVLLAITVFLTIIQDKLPEASEPAVSWLTYKLLVDLFIGCLLVVMVIVGLSFYHREGQTKYVEKVLCVNLCQKKKHSSKTKVCDISDENIQTDPSWKKVALGLDRICLVVFTLAFLCNNIVYLLVMSQ